MKNLVLKREMSMITSNPKNIIVTEGGVSGNSIEVEFIEPQSFDSFCYYGNKADRDEDLLTLNEKLK